MLKSTILGIDIPCINWNGNEKQDKKRYKKSLSGHKAEIKDNSV